MPTRYLKPGIRDSDAIDRLRPAAEVLFYRLLVTVDDFGRADARPAMIKAACFPIKESVDAAGCAELLDDLAAAALIDLYIVDGKPYLQMRKWDNVPRARDSKFPACSDTCAQVYADARNPRTLLPVTGTGTGTETENRKPEPQTGTVLRTGPQAAPAAPRKPRAEKPTDAAWDAYTGAFVHRYGTDPVRNATTNAQMAQFVGRIGADEAPHVAAFYVGHNGAFYVRGGHAIGGLLKDAEKLRTEWATRRQITATAAQQADRTQTNLDAFAPLLAKARADRQQQEQGAEHAE